MNPIITGKTDDGKQVVYASLFKWKDQEGLPIDISVKKMEADGFVPDWLAELEGGLWVGLSLEHIVTELNEVFHILYPEKKQELMERVNNYIEFRQTPNPYTLHLLKLTKS